jgi:hypothetical protein
MATWEGRRNQEHTVNTSQQVGVYLTEKRYRDYGGEQGISVNNKKEADPLAIRLFAKKKPWIMERLIFPSWNF